MSRYLAISLLVNFLLFTISAYAEEGAVVQKVYKNIVDPNIRSTPFGESPEHYGSNQSSLNQNLKSQVSKAYNQSLPPLGHFNDLPIMVFLPKYLEITETLNALYSCQGKPGCKISRTIVLPEMSFKINYIISGVISENDSLLSLNRNIAKNDIEKLNEFGYKMETHFPSTIHLQSRYRAPNVSKDSIGLKFEQYPTIPIVIPLFKEKNFIGEYSLNGKKIVIDYRQCNFRLKNCKLKIENKVIDIDFETLNVQLNYKLVDVEKDDSFKQYFLKNAFADLFTRE